MVLQCCGREISMLFDEADGSIHLSDIFEKHPKKKSAVLGRLRLRVLRMGTLPSQGRTKMPSPADASSGLSARTTGPPAWLPPRKCRPTSSETHGTRAAPPSSSTASRLPLHSRASAYQTGRTGTFQRTPVLNSRSAHLRVCVP